MKAESKQHQIFRPASQIYAVISKFSNFTPILADKVENWQADEDTCSFTAKGFNIELEMVERVENELIKIAAVDGATPFPFTFWLQLKELAPNDTRMRVVIDAKLNMMMKMMVGGKLAKAADQIAQQLADGFNGKITPDMASQP